MLEEPVEIEEVKMIKIKPRPFLATFVEKFTRGGGEGPLLLTRGCELIIMANESSLLITPEKLELDRLVKIDLTSAYVYNYIKAGLIPITEISSGDLAGKAERIVEELYGHIKSMEPDAVFTFQGETIVPLPGEPVELAWLLNTAYEYARILGVKSSVRIHIYDLNREYGIVEIVPRSNLGMVFKVKK